MSAAADPDAVSVCVLSDAQRGDGSAACAVDVDSRSFGARSMAHFAGCDYRDHADHAAHDAAGGHGSGAAEDDEHHDAGYAGPHELEPAGRVGLVLVRGAVDWDRAAVGDESHIAGARDARDDGEAGAEEREIAFGCWPLALTKSQQLRAKSYLCRLLTRLWLLNRLGNFCRLSFRMAASS